MPELRLRDVVLHYEQSGAGPDIVWLAAGTTRDRTGAASRRRRSTAITAARPTTRAAADGHFHLLEGLGHGSAFGHRPDEVNACIRAILNGSR